MALTTTTGRCLSRPRTISTTRPMALASPTEVPPNFMTMQLAIICSESHLSQNQGKMGHPLWRRVHAGSFQISLGFQQLGIKQCRTGSAADGVVREQGKFPVEH